MAEAQYSSFEPMEGMSVNEQRLINALEANVIEADTIQGSEISEQRQRNHVHYALDRLGNERKGRSQHITADVHDIVESQKALYREATQADSKFFKFEPEDDQDNQAHLATAYVNGEFYSEYNNGERIIRDSLHDAFVAKRAVACVEWKRDSKLVYERFQNVVPNQLAQLQAMPQFRGFQNLQQMAAIGPQGRGVAFMGTAVFEEDTSHAYVKVVQPERYYRDPNVAYIHESAFAGYQADLSRYALVDLGYDPDEVMNLDLDYRFRQNEEDAARKAHDSTWSRARRHKRDPAQEIVTVYWHYAYLDLSHYMDGVTEDQIAGTKLYKFCFSQGKLLTLPESGDFYEEVQDGYPFIEWVQYKISHAEYGLCDADLAGPIQWSKSNLLRLSIDNIAMTNTSRWKARQGYIKNPRELLDNNIGSVLWMRDLNALEPLETPTLSQWTPQVYEQLEQDKETRTGVSRLAKGMNSDAIRYQNADDMVERLTNASNRRSMMGVRDFANEYLSAIAKRIYDLGRKYDTRQRTVELAGQWIQITPQQFIPRSKIKIRTALTPDDRQREAQFLLMLHQHMQQDPELMLLYGLQQKHALLDDVADLMGVGDTSRYMLQPNSPEVGQKLQAQQQQQQQMQQMQQAILQIQTQLRLNEDERAERKLDLEFMDKATDNSRADEELDWDNYWKRQELQLERQQQRSVAVGG